jgi:hypothetical protein
MGPRPKRVREQAVVYLGSGDRELLERLGGGDGPLPYRTVPARAAAARPGAPRRSTPPGSSLDHLIDTAGGTDFPPDVAERHDAYLYGGGYARHVRERRARPD